MRSAVLGPPDMSSRQDPFGAEEKLYTPKQVAERLGVSERWVRDHATRRKPMLTAVKLGPLLRFRWTDVQAFIESLTDSPSHSNRTVLK